MVIGSSEETVPIGEYLVPKRMTVTTTETDRARRVQMKVELRDGGPAILSVQVFRDDGEPIALADMRDLPLHRWAQEAMERAAHTPEGGDYWSRKPVGIGRRPGRGLTDARVKAAADAYSAAKADGMAVKRAVAEALNVSEPQASVYIRKAKERGLL